MKTQMYTRTLISAVLICFLIAGLAHAQTCDPSRDYCFAWLGSDVITPAPPTELAEITAESHSRTIDYADQQGATARGEPTGLTTEFDQPCFVINHAATEATTSSPWTQRLAANDHIIHQVSSQLEDDQLSLLTLTLTLDPAANTFEVSWQDSDAGFSVHSDAQLLVNPASDQDLVPIGQGDLTTGFDMDDDNQFGFSFLLEKITETTATTDEEDPGHYLIYGFDSNDESSPWTVSGSPDLYSDFDSIFTGTYLLMNITTYDATDSQNLLIDLDRLGLHGGSF